MLQKFLNGLLKDIRRLDATWVTHNDNAQAKLPHSQHQKAMIICLTNMLEVDLKEQQMISTPATFTTFKDDKGPCTYCNHDTHTWEQCRNRIQDHQLKKDVGSLDVSLNEQNRIQIDYCWSRNLRNSSSEAQYSNTSTEECWWRAILQRKPDCDYATDANETILRQHILVKQKNS